MDKQQKQIEEMANDVRSYYHGSEYDELEDDISFSEHLVNLGWIKLDENTMVLTREEFDEDYATKEDRDYWKHKAEIYKEHLKKAHKETVEKIINDISNDILVVNTKEYGNIEVVPVERLQEIIQTLEVNE